MHSHEISESEFMAILFTQMIEVLAFIETLEPMVIIPVLEILHATPMLAGPLKNIEPRLSHTNLLVWGSIIPISPKPNCTANSFEVFIEILPRTDFKETFLDTKMSGCKMEDKPK